NLPLDTTYTDATGNYLFTGLTSGNYFLDFDYTTSPGGQDYVWTTANAAAATSTTDSDVVPTSGQINAFAFDASTGDNLTLDGGLIPVADIGDFVWEDTDLDGIQDPSETGIANVKVVLYHATTMMRIDSVFTDATGAYLFENLPAGDYALIFDASTNSTGENYQLTTPGAGTTNNDSDPDPTSGQTATFTFDPTTGDDLSIDAGWYPTASLGDYVWVDTDMDGIQDPSEAGLDSVLVILLNADNGTAIDSAWTNSAGQYLFTDLPAGNYFLGFEPNASFLHQNYTFSTANTGNGVNDSDPDNNGFTEVIAFDPTTGNDLSIDAGLSAAANIGNYVWIDTDGDGVQDGAETGIENVEVVLYNHDTGLAIDTVWTDGNGNYLFDNIPSGNYYIAFNPSTSSLSTHYTFATQGAGTSATDSDANSSGQTAVFAFDASTSDELTIDAGILPVPFIETVKSITASDVLPNGHLDLTFRLGLRNTGTIDLTNISLRENLATSLGAAFVGLSATAPNLAILSSTATITPTLDATFDGNANDDVFVGAATDLLAPGQEITLLLIVEVDPLLANWPLMNQTNARGEGLDANGNLLTSGGLAVSAADVSDSGSNYDSTNPGEPGDNGTSNDPTQINCLPANVIVTGEPSGLCPGEAVTLNVSSNIVGASYEWRIVGSSTVIATSTTATFSGLTSDTDYEVTVINPSSTCYYDLLDTASITIFTAPSAIPTANYTLSPSCAPADLTLMAGLTVGSAAIVSYAWTGPNGFSSSVQNPVIPNATSANNGTYTLVAIDANGCSVQASVQISTIADPQAQPVITGTGPACVGEQITLTAPQYTGSSVSYNWTTPSGTTTGISGNGTHQIIISPVDNTIHPGVYTLAIAVDGCNLSATYEVATFATPSASAAYVSTDTCDGGSIQLTGSGTGTAPLAYIWTGPNGFSSTLQNPSIDNVDATDNGTYVLTVSSASGCTAVSSVSVDNILAASVLPAIATNGPAICNGDTLFLSTSSTGTLFEWIRNSDSQSSLAQPGMTTGVDNTVIPPDHPEYTDGPWRVRVTDLNGCV
ncbi:MAG: SdrD B-like domain-containing protein, partial [Bacteroidota bacterium]